MEVGRSDDVHAGGLGEEVDLEGGREGGREGRREGRESKSLKSDACLFPSLPPPLSLFSPPVLSERRA